MVEVRPKNNILIVDDTPANLRLLSQMLAGQGYHARPLPDGSLALAAVRADPPDLILLDIMMPDIKGYEVCKKIKENPETQNTKIIVLSAYLDEEKFKKMKEHGADACFSKPFPLPQLKEEVARLLGLR